MDTNELKQKYIEPLKVFWTEKEPKQKKKIIAGAIGVLAVVIGIVAFLNYTPYSVLFSGLENQEVTEVLAKLQEDGVAAKIEDGGTILVPKDQEASLKMSLASSGYPKSGLSYDLFTNNIDMMATDSDRKAFQIYQLQERIQEAIKTISGVKNAIVTLNIPDSKGFVLSSDKQNASASVVLTLSSGVTLDSGQVNGIKQLVSKSVPNMTGEDVSVVDGNTGLELSANLNSITGKADDQLKIEEKIDKNIEKKVRDILVPLVGKDNLQVVATSKINSDSGIKQSVQYTPANENVNTGVIGKADYYLEGGDGTILQSGVPGAETNAEGVPIYPQVTENNGQNFINQGTLDYYVNETKEEVHREGIVVEQITVGVIINSNTFDEAKQDEIANLVATAVNIPAENVAIYASPFENGSVAAMGDWSPAEFFQQYKWPIIIGLVALIVLIVLIIIVMMRKRRKQAEQFWAPPVEERKIEVPIMEEKIEESKQQVLIKQVKGFADEHPEVAAQLIRTWIKGDDE